MAKYIIFIKIIFFLLLSSPIVGVAQSFGWEAPVYTSDSSGFFKIYLTADITAHLKSGFPDIRIFDDFGKEIPYLKKYDRNISENQEVIPLKITHNKHNLRKRYTEIIVQNPDNQTINNINLLVNQKDAEKWINIQASNDQKEWVVLKENIVVPGQISDSATVVVNIFDFPVSNYRYYKVILHDAGTKKINVLSAFKYNISISDINYTTVPSPKIEQNDTTEADKTTVFLTFAKTQYIDKMSFEIDGPDYYLRRCELRNVDTTFERRIRITYFNQLDKTFYFSSTTENVLHLNSQYGRRFKLVIDNKDDVPLTIKSVTAHQQQVYLICYVQKNKNYILRFGDKIMTPPIYDLRFFEDSIPHNIAALQVGHIKQLPRKQQHKELRVNFNIVYLWTAVGIVTTLLLFISIRMLMELKHRQD